MKEEIDTVIFKDRKVPRHLIIRDEYELRPKNGKGGTRIMVSAVVLFGLAYLLVVIGA